MYYGQTINININIDSIISAIIDDDADAMMKLLQNEEDIKSIRLIKIIDYCYFKYPRILSYNPNLLMVVSFFGAEKCFNELVANGCGFNEKDLHLKTVAHFACAGGNMNIIRFLYSENVNFKSEADDFDTSPAYLAIKYGHLDVIKYMHIHGYEKFDTLEKRVPAFYYGYIDIAHFFIEKIPLEDEKKYYFEYMIQACNGGNETIANWILFLAQKNNKNFTTNQAQQFIEYAIKSGSISTIKLLCGFITKYFKNNYKEIFIYGLKVASSGLHLDILFYFMKVNHIKKMPLSEIEESIECAVQGDNIYAVGLFFSKIEYPKSIDRVLHLVKYAESYRMIQYLFAFVGADIKDYLKDVLQVAILQKQNILLHTLQSQNYSFATVTDSMLENVTSLNKLVFLVHNGAPIKFTSENGPVQSALRSGYINNLIELESIGCKLSNEMIFKSGCFGKKLIPQNLKFFSFIIENCEDLNYHLYPYFFESIIKECRKHPQFLTLACTAVSKGCIVDKVFVERELLSDKDMWFFKPVLISLIIHRRICNWDFTIKGGNVEVSLQKIYQILTKSDLCTILLQTPKVFADLFYTYSKYYTNCQEEEEVAKGNYLKELTVKQNIIIK